MKITLIGTGYVGLVSGACFAEFGFEVTCVDHNKEKIEALQKGHIPIYEPGLGSLVHQSQKAGRLHFTTDLATAVSKSEVIFIAVGTPSRDDNEADLQDVFKGVDALSPFLQSYSLVVTKSTVPVGTARQIQARLQRNRPDLKLGQDFNVASNPEFLREGSALSDFMRPDRVLIGLDPAVSSSKAETLLRHLYRPLYLLETPLVFTDLESSELAKYAANSFLAMKITFINEMANLCEKTGANVQEVAKAIGLDGRIGRKFLHTGPGYGGSCFPKDTKALAAFARKAGTPLQLVDTVIQVNEKRPFQMAEKIAQALPPSSSNVLAILGLTFKPNTDDMREAPSLIIIPELQKRGISLRLYDPVAKESAYSLFPNVSWCQTPYEACHNADGVVILTEWNEFRALDLNRLMTLLKSPLLFDLRNIYKLEEMAEAGFHYVSLGRPILQPASHVKKEMVA